MSCVCRGAGQSQPWYQHLLQNIPASRLGMAERVCVTSPAGAGLSTKFYWSQTSLTHQVANSSGYAFWSSTIGCPTRQGAEVASRARGTLLFPSSSQMKLCQTAWALGEGASHQLFGWLLLWPSVCLETSAKQVSA